jgi:hypothetical protein
VSLATGFIRAANTSVQGTYSFEALPAGRYELSVELAGFQRITRTADVEAGATTTSDFSLNIGEVTESISVAASTALIRPDSHAVTGVITRDRIEKLPLNGRSFLELAKLEPGVQPPSRAANNRVLLPVLGAAGGASGRGTRVTIDGGDIQAFSTGGSAFGVSQEVVQEFQTATANFDLSTGQTFTGAINVATRSGGNDLHGTAFFFFRDHALSAYPALRRDPANPDPFFQRRQLGFATGGPIVGDRLFFFGNWERNEQRGVAAATLFGADFAHLSRTTSSPLFGNQFSLRLDGRLTGNHTAFLRHSHDGSRAFGAVAGIANAFANSYPSNWTRQLVWADQSIIGVTSIIRPTVVNDFRFSYFFLSAKQLAAEEQNCPGCLGIGAPTITIPQAGMFIGQSSTSLNPGRRFDLNNSIAWQTGTHRVRFGGEWEHNRGGLLTWSNEPVTMTLFSPDQVRAYNRLPQTPENLRIPLPALFLTLDDILQLPLQSMTIGVGDPRVQQANGSTVRTWHTARLYIQDNWRVSGRLTVNYGLAWNVDRYKNYDLTKPALLAPLLGANGLEPTRKEWKNFSPVLGLAWTPSSDRNTVLRAGAGIYYDFFFQPDIDNERALLGRPGTGRTTVAGTSVANPIAGMPGVALGAPLNFPGSPTRFTGADLMTILPAVRAGLTSSLANADPSSRTIEVTKQAPGGLYPAYLPNWSAQHVSAGIQREILSTFVVTADFVYRHFIHGGLGAGGVDLNHFNSVRGPIIPRCAGAQASDPRAICSTGPINVYQATSNQTYKGLLVRADKRFSHRFETLASYAFSSNVGTPGTGGNTAAGATSGPGLDLDNWHQKPRPLITDYTHIANLAGVGRLPYGLEVGLNWSYSSAPAFSATVGSGATGIDFNGDGTTGDLLPGTTAGSFNRDLGRADLVRLVDQFNQTYAGKGDSHSRPIPRINLPTSYSFDHGFQSLDVRLTRTFVIRERWKMSLIGEVFNLYNAANLSGYSGDLTSPAFGQPTARFTQTFGSGGPRAFQLAMRFRF